MKIITILGAVNSYKKGMKLLHTCDGGCYEVWVVSLLASFVRSLRLPSARCVLEKLWVFFILVLMDAPDYACAATDWLIAFQAFSDQPLIQ